MQGGDNGQRSSGIESQGAQHDQRYRSEDLAEQDCEQGQDLGASTRLAIDAGTEIAHAKTDVEQRGDDENAEVAAKNQDSDSPWHELLVHEHQEQGTKQKLVGHGIEVLTDLGLLLEQSGSQAIEAVTESGDDEEAKRGLIVGLENREYKKRYEAEAQESKQVRSCAQFFQQGFPVFLGVAQNLDGT
jgi:hypothetical protein